MQNESHDPLLRSFHWSDPIFPQINDLRTLRVCREVCTFTIGAFLDSMWAGYSYLSTPRSRALVVARLMKGGAVFAPGFLGGTPVLVVSKLLAFCALISRPREIVARGRVFLIADHEALLDDPVIGQFVLDRND